MLPLATASAQPIQCPPKIDNFVLFDDQSGSMYKHHREAGEIKQLMAKEVIRQIVPIIPETWHLGSLYMFAPFETVSPPAVTWRRALLDGVERIPDSQPVAIRTTPMGDGFDELDAAAGWQKGKTDVIVLSDGGDNGYPDPIAEAREMASAHPGMCIHVISFADCDHGRQVNEALSRIGSGCQLVDGPTLLRDAGKREQFVRDVFCAPPPPPPPLTERRGG
jgi:OOP family OmpA-OmpF porin